MFVTILFVLYQRMDIVLLSDADEPGQWIFSSKSQNDQLWPNSWLKKALPKSINEVYQIQYSVVDWIDNCAPLLRIAWYILHQLEKLLQKTQRPFIILAPSVGGLIVKQMCLCAPEVPQFWLFYQRIAGIIFYGCPHTILSSNNLADFLLEEVINLRLEKSTVRLIEPKFIALNNSFEEILKENEIYKSMQILSFGIKTTNELQKNNNNYRSTEKINHFFEPSFGKFILIQERRFCNLTIPKSPEDFIYWKAFIFIKNLIRTHPSFINIDINTKNEEKQQQPNAIDIVTILIDPDRNLTLYIGPYEETKSLEQQINIILYQIKIESIFEAIKECIDKICYLLYPIDDDETQSYKENELIFKLSTLIQNNEFQIHLIGPNYTIDVVHDFLLYYFQIKINKTGKKNQISPNGIKIIDLNSLPNLQGTFSSYNALEISLKPNKAHSLLLNKLNELTELDNISNITKNINLVAEQKTNKILDQINQILSILLTKPKISLLGHPNAGKSTLINALCGESKVTVDSSECTGTITELISFDSKDEEEKKNLIEIYYITEKELDEVINEYTSQLMHHFNKEEIIEKSNQMKQIYYNRIQNLKIDEKTLKPFEKINNSNKLDISSYLSLCQDIPTTLLISKVIIYVRKKQFSKWMDDIILLDTPGLFSHKSYAPEVHTYPLTDRRAFEGAISSNIWIFLTDQQAVSISLENDLNHLIEYSPKNRGLVCITKFDVCAASMKHKSLTKLLAQKRKQILACCRIPKPPAIIPLILSNAVDYKLEFNRFKQQQQQNVRKNLSKFKYSAVREHLLRSMDPALLTHIGKNGVYYFNQNQYVFDDLDENIEEVHEDDLNNSISLEEDNYDDDDDDDEIDDESTLELKSFSEYLDLNNTIKSINITYCVGVELSLVHSFIENIENMLEISKFQEINLILQSLTNEISHEIIRIEQEIKELEQHLPSNNKQQFNNKIRRSTQIINESLQNIDTHKKENYLHVKTNLKEYKSKFERGIKNSLENNLRIPIHDEVNKLIKQTENVKRSKFSLFRKTYVYQIPNSFVFSVDQIIRECFLTSITKFNSNLDKKIPFDIILKFNTRAKSLIGSFQPFRNYVKGNNNSLKYRDNSKPLDFIQNLVDNVIQVPIGFLIDEILKELENVITEQLYFQKSKKTNLHPSLVHRNDSASSYLLFDRNSSHGLDSSGTFVAKEKVNSFKKERDILLDSISCIYKLYYRGLTREQYCAVLVGSQFTTIEKTYFKNILRILELILRKEKETFCKIQEINPIIESKEFSRFTKACDLELQSFIRSCYFNTPLVIKHENNFPALLQSYELNQDPENFSSPCLAVIFLRERDQKFYFDIIGASELLPKGNGDHLCFINSTPLCKKLKLDELKEYFTKYLYCVGIYSKKD